jgi:hypothetical protein
MPEKDLISKDFVELSADLKKRVAESRIPTVDVVEVDGRFKALSLRAGKSITGPYRALKLSPHPYSDARVTNIDKAKKMGELFFRFETKSINSLIDPDGSDESRVAKQGLTEQMTDQKKQIPDGFKLSNLDLGDAGLVDLIPGDPWAGEYVRHLDRSGSNLLQMNPPNEAQTAEEVLRYQLSAMVENKKLANPMYLSGYIPPMSVEESIRLIDVYLSAGLNTLIYDFRGRNGVTDGSLVHLAAATAESENPIYVHGLQVSAYKMAKPYYTLYDLVMARVGVQSVSNLRRVGGGGKKSDVPTHMKRRIKCIHGYVMPSLLETYPKGPGRFMCPHCDTSVIDAAVQENSPSKITRAAIKQNVETSQTEFDTLKARIKECTFEKHFVGKSGLQLLEPQFARFEKAISRERTKIKESTEHLKP